MRWRLAALSTLSMWNNPKAASVPGPGREERKRWVETKIKEERGEGKGVDRGRRRRRRREAPGGTDGHGFAASPFTTMAVFGCCKIFEKISFYI